MRVKFHRNLLLVGLIHTIIGEVGLFLIPSMNYFQQYIMPLANRSLSDHYNIILTEQSYAWVWSSMAAADTIGNFFASAILFYLIEKFGSRDVVMIMRNTLSTIACILFASANATLSVEFIFVARFLTGICASCSNVMYLYLSESIPDNFRGTMSMVLGLGGGGWVMLATVIAMPQIFGNEKLWPLYMVIPIIPNLIHTAFVFIFPRSPKFLYITKRNQKEAVKSVKYFYGQNVDLETVLLTYDHEAILAMDNHSVSYRTIIKTNHLFRPFLICIFATMSGIFNGEQIAKQYSNTILVMFGVPQEHTMFVLLAIQIITTGFGVVNSFYLIEKVGRRKMQLINVSIAILGMVSIFVANLTNPEQSGGSKTSVGFGFTGFLCIGFSNVLGIEGIPKLLVGELNPQSTRAKTATATYVISNILSFILVIAWPPLQQVIGAYSFLPLIIGEIICFIFLFYYLPETRNLSVDQIVSQWCNEQELDTNREHTRLLRQNSFDYRSIDFVENFNMTGLNHL